jgi:hypothetical protein
MNVSCARCRVPMHLFIAFCLTLLLSVFAALPAEATQPISHWVNAPLNAI